MKRLVLALCLISFAAISGVFYYGGGEAVNLENQIGFDKHTQKIITGGSDDPTTVSKTGGAGSVYFRTNGDAYIKTDDGSSTNWDKFYAGVIDYLDFSTATTTVHTHLNGRLHWDTTDKTLSLDIDSTKDLELQIGQESYIRAVNKTLATIADCKVVYISGAQGNRPAITLADASAINTSMAIGVTTEEILNNEEGMVTTQGRVGNCDTSGFTAGDRLYLDVSTAGALTATAPATPYKLIPVAYALDSTNNGHILVDVKTILDTDSSLTSNSDLIAPSQKATKTYADTKIAKPTCTAGQIVEYNGTDFICVDMTSSQGQGVVYYFQTVASDIVGYDVLDGPEIGVEVTESVAVNSGTSPALIDPYATSEALGRTSISSGVWEFTFFASSSSIVGNNKIQVNVYARTATGTENLLFTTLSGDISSTSIAPLNWDTVQPEFTINDTDRLVVKVYGFTDQGTNRTISFTHNGSERNSHFHTPLIYLHNELGGLQGGLEAERYHVNAAESATITKLSTTAILSDLSGLDSIDLETRSAKNLDGTAVADWAYNFALYDSDGVESINSGRSLFGPSGLELVLWDDSVFTVAGDVNASQLFGSYASIDSITTLSLGIQGSSSLNNVSINAQSGTDAYDLYLPGSQGSLDSLLSNDGTGNLVWSTNLSLDSLGSKTINNVDKDNFIVDGGFEQGVSGFLCSVGTCTSETATVAQGSKGLKIVSSSATASVTWSTTNAAYANRDIGVSCEVRSATATAEVCGWTSAGNQNCRAVSTIDSWNLIQTYVTANSSGNFGLRVGTSNSTSATIYVDNCKASADPFRTLEITATSTMESYIITPAKNGMESWVIRQVNNTLADLSGGIQFDADMTAVKNNTASSFTGLQATSNLVYADGSNPTKFFCSKPCKIITSMNVYIASGDGRSYIYKNGSYLVESAYTRTTNHNSFVNFEFDLNGTTDYFTFQTNDSVSNNTDAVNVSILAIAQDAQYLAAIPVPKVAYLKDVKSNSTAGGTSGNNAYVQRTINVLNEDGSTTNSGSTFVTLDTGTSSFTLPSGEYHIKACAPACKVGSHKIKLKNNTTGTFPIVGASAYTLNSSDYASTLACLEGKITLASSSVFSIWHYSYTSTAGYGLGVATGSGDSEIYTEVSITKYK